MSLDALQVWRELAAECGPAVNYYSRKGANGRRILQRGAADFDAKCFPDDARERAHYRADYYVSQSGYMDMHIKHNLAALRHGFQGGTPQPLLFVDFGCGPMTSGLALAELLSRQTSGYKKQTAYFGVDASANMVATANRINARYGLFAPERFKVVRGTRFDSRKIPHFFPKPRAVVLCLSFVLAQGTLKSDTTAKKAVMELSADWKKYVAGETRCRETTIIYLNPGYFDNTNWSKFFHPVMLNSDTTDGFRYTGQRLKNIPVPGLSKDIALGLIRGLRE